MSTETITNGKVTSASSIDMISTSNELEQPKAKKTRSGGNNKAIDFNLDIDAGAKRIKSRLNGVYKHFPSEAKLISSEVPLRNDGCFSFKKKNYVVGTGIDRVNGELIVSSQDNKLSHLDVWIVGAITHYRKQLKSAVDSRRRKNQPVNINLYLRIVTLSSPERKKLDKDLKQISEFIWEDTEFKVNVKTCEFIDEGEGAAIEICHTHNHDKFHLIDLGGGTLTHTTYSWDGDELGTVAKTPISGAGMTSVMNKIFKALTRTDRGGILAENSDIQEALELSEISTDGLWKVPLRSNGKVKDISEEVRGALSEWVGNNYALQKQFDLIAQKLARGEYVYCSGGGFAVKVISQWIIEYLSNGIANAKIDVLENPQHINLTGLKWLDK
jgi:hypothetical protein